MSLLIGKHINATLRGYAPFMEAVDGRVFPIVYPVDKGTPKYPYVVYASNGIETEDDKNADVDQDEVTVELIVCAKRYDEMIAVANLIRKAFVQQDLEHPDFNIDEYDFSSGQEDYDLAADCYYVPLNLHFITSE